MDDTPPPPRTVQDEDTIVTPLAPGATLPELSEDVDHIERLTRPGAKYRNMNPFYVLCINYETSPEDMNRRYRRLSIKVHPDKFPGNPKAAAAFEAINEAYKTLKDDEKREYCTAVVARAREKVLAEVKAKKRAAKRDKISIEEDDPKVVERLIEVEVHKIFVEIEQKKLELEEQDVQTTKRKRDQEEQAKVATAKVQAQKEAWENKREDRVSNWRDFKGKASAPAAKRRKFTPKGLRPPPLEDKSNFKHPSAALWNAKRG
eukprot:gnl/Spiro4/18001_TR9607_c0_g1_i1.p1 gnl/Spiro4/18001_TR9607_c0_g1~~gnl/Spiro4/18001_TR9607_c0_g1_i1.p1  ORF type:complete len:273 (+),score=63.75 gnl/Spiro4/18001_TR9607_c0_g1_i1:38-820(+)